MKNGPNFVVYGTNDKAEILIQQLEVAYIIDRDPQKWGIPFREIPVFDPHQLLAEDPETLVVVLAFRPGSDTYAMILREIRNMGLSELASVVSMYDVLSEETPYEEIRPYSDYAPWKVDTEFTNTFEIIRHNTLIDKYRAYGLWSIVDQVSNLNGALLEIGVWKGGSGALIAKRSSICNIPDTVYLCDTFSGVVKTNPVYDPFYKGGEHSDTSEEIVRTLVNDQMKLKNAKILKGIFPEETSVRIAEQNIRFCHIDVDVYQSAKDIFEWVWPRMVVGGVVVFDDYGFMCCEGITKYVNDLKTRDDTLFIYSIVHGIIVKTKL